MATSAATSLVTAMATDAWQTVRTRLAKLLGSGDQRAEQVALDTLDEDAAALTATPESGDLAQELTAQWRGRLRDLLRNDPNAANALAELVSDLTGSPGAASAGAHSVAAGRDVHIEASQGGIAAGTIHGSVNAPPHPSQPGADTA